jgi:superfamily II DNA or RNA helicase
VYAQSYTRILEHFGNAYTVGLTATPVRLDGSGLGKINDDLVVGPSVSELIEMGHLAPFRYFAHVSADTSRLQVKRGEFVADDVNRLMGQDTVYGDAVDNYRKYGCIKTIVYCSSIANSTATAKAFLTAGIPAAHVDGETPAAKRDSIMRAFRDGHVKVLCNVDLVSEGFDVPDCDSCILLRPTMSLTLHIQQSMRSMRYIPGKTAVIIDQVENFKRHGLPDTDREWTLDYKKKKEEPEEHTRTCSSCYGVYDMATIICPECKWDMRKAHCVDCETEQQYGKGECIYCGGGLERGQKREKEIIADADFEEIVSFSFKDWRDCQSIKELQRIQKAKGYKPGWVYYKAKELALI